MNNTANALSVPSSVYDDGIEHVLDTPINRFSEGSITHKEYIRAVKKDLTYNEDTHTNNGDTYSGSELQTMRSELMSNYKTIMDAHKKSISELRAMKKALDADKRSGLDSELLTAKYDDLENKERHLKEEYASSRRDYMSALGKIDRQRYQAEMTEGKTLDQVLDDKSTDAYQKFTLAERLLKNKKTTELYAEDGIAALERAYEKIDALAHTEKERNGKLTLGEEKAYERLTEHLNLLQASFRRSYEMEQAQHKQELEAEVIPFLTQESESVVHSPLSRREKLHFWFLKHTGGMVAGLILTIGVACASLYNVPANSNQLLSTPASYASVTQTPMPAYTPPPLPLHSSIPKPTPLPPVAAKPAPKVLQPGEYEVKQGETLWNLSLT